MAPVQLNHAVAAHALRQVLVRRAHDDLLHARIGGRHRRRRGQRIVRLELHHRPHRHAERGERLLERLELGVERRVHALAGLVAGPEVVAERLDDVVGGHAHDASRRPRACRARRRPRRAPRGAPAARSGRRPPPARGSSGTARRCRRPGGRSPPERYARSSPGAVESPCREKEDPHEDPHRCGLGRHAPRRRKALAELVTGLDELGFDSLWLSEVLTGPVLDPVVGLAWAARATHG